MLSNLQIRILKFLYPNKTVIENVLSEKFNLTCQEQAVKDLAAAKLIRLDSSRLYQPVRISLTETGCTVVLADAAHKPYTTVQLIRKGK